MVLLRIAIFVLFSVSSAWAQPSISSISGTISDGNSITINGSSFGTGDATPILYDNFESGTDTAVLNASPQVGTWVLDNRPSSTYCTTRFHSGAKASCVTNTPSSQWGNFEITFGASSKFYQNYWFWYSAGSTDGQFKLTQIHGDSGVGDFAPGVMTGSSGLDWWFSYISTEGGANDVATRVNYPSVPTQSAWHRVEIIGRQSSAGNVADGFVQIRLDETLVYDKQNVITRESSSFNWTSSSYAHGMTNFTGNVTTSLDDVYANNCWCRVILSNSSTWAGIAQGELQRATAWSTTAVTVVLNKGGFSDLNSKYIYVVDENNTVNANGFALSAGGSAGGALSIRGTRRGGMKR